MKYSILFVGFLLVGCTHTFNVQFHGDKESQTAVLCNAFSPIYLSEEAIAVLKPFREDREKIAQFNVLWSKICEKD